MEEDIDNKTEEEIVEIRSNQLAKTKVNSFRFRSWS